MVFNTIAIISKTIGNINQEFDLFSLSETVVFSCCRIVSRYVERIEYYRYAILTLSDAVLSSQG